MPAAVTRGTVRAQRIQTFPRTSLQTAPGICGTIVGENELGPPPAAFSVGEGIGIAVRRGNELLRQALNWALFRIWEQGRFTDLWLRYFPISPF